MTQATIPTATPNPKPSWPLFALAALGFVPFAGILFGAIGLSWGLVSSRRRAMLAAMIAGGGALLNIVAVMVIGLSNIGSVGGLGTVRRQMAEREMLGLVVALEKYHDKEQAYPQALDELPGHTGVFRLVGLMDQSAGPLHQTREYTYRLSADGDSYDLFAVGPDGVMGTADDIRPALPDSIKTHSGFRPATSGDHQ